MMHLKSFTGFQSTVATLVLAATSLSCGSRKAEDIETQKNEAAQAEKDVLVIGGNNTAGDSVAVTGSCEVELKQSSEFDPENPQSQVVVVFKGRVEERCIAPGQSAQVYIYSAHKLSLPGATCGPNEGDFNLKCQGDIVRSDGVGNLEIRFDSKDNQEQLAKLRIKVKYEDSQK